jgi:glycosyltransferase involved in cell wall biosynthesis
MNTPFFTVIVASFNAGDKLNSTLESLLAQTFTDYEVIVKDGGSEDGSTDQLPRDPRIRLIRRKDGGIYDGMNQALASAAGEYIYFLNCGDVLHDAGVLEKVAAAIDRDRHSAEGRWTREERESLRPKRGPLPYVADRQNIPGGRSAVIYYGDVMEMQTGQRVCANPSMDRFAMYRYLPCHQACFYTRSLFRERRFNTAYRVRADYEHFLWSVIRGGARTVAMPVIVADYEGGGYSETEKGRELSAAEHRQITAEYFTQAERFWYRAYLVATLQPLREKLARGRHTAALYDRVKNGVYARKSHKDHRQEQDE